MRALLFSLAVGMMLDKVPVMAAAPAAKNLVLIMTDGLRWQEVFNGADPQLLNKEHGGVENLEKIQLAYGRGSNAEKRTALMPFFWNVIAKQGQLFGNQAKGSVVKVSNRLNFSYPGYSETFTGKVDPKMNSNEKVSNPNVNVFEWLNQRAAFKGKVAAFGTWEVFPYILNRDRSGLPVFAGFEAITKESPSEKQQVLNELIRDTTPIWSSITLDSFHFQASMEFIRLKRPRLLFIGYGETDEWAHSGRYDQVLEAAHRVDDYIRRLWEVLLYTPGYRNNTVIVVTTDHGRGQGLKDWKNHGEKVPGSEGTWLAVLGPKVAALGERTNTPPVLHTQIAPTIAALLGEDFKASFPESSEPILDVLPGGQKP